MKLLVFAISVIVLSQPALANGRTRPTAAQLHKMMCKYAAEYSTISTRDCLRNTELAFYKTKTEDKAYINYPVCPGNFLVQITYDYKTKEMEYADDYSDDPQCDDYQGEE